MYRLELLRSKALFGGLSDDRLKKLASRLKTDKFKQGEIVIKEDEVGDRMYMIVKGQVIIKKHVPGEDRDDNIGTLKEGESFGELEFIDIQPRSATVIAGTDLETLSLSNPDLLWLYKQDLEAFATIIINIARIISRRFRKLDNKLVSLLHQ